MRVEWARQGKGARLKGKGPSVFSLQMAIIIIFEKRETYFKGKKIMFSAFPILNIYLEQN